MPTTSVIPGVTVRTIFEPAPVLPGATGVLGAVGVTDRGPLEPTAVGSFTEFLDVFGEASRFTMPDVRAAFANGVARAVVARTAPGRGAKGVLDLLDDEGEQVVRLIARAEGDWAKRVGVRVTQVRTLRGLGVRYVNLEIAVDGEVVETIGNLVMDVSSEHYLFDRVNAQSRVVVAVDPLMEQALPAVVGATALDTSGARASTAVLKRGAAGAVLATAKRRGRTGDRLSVQVSDGRASLALADAAATTAAIVQARVKGPDGTKIKVAVVQVDPTTIQLAITPDGGVLRTTANATTVAELVASVANDPDVLVEAVGAQLPVAVASTALARTVDVQVNPTGADPRVASDVLSLDALVAVSDRDVAFTKVAGATQLPDSGPGIPLAGGRDEGPALVLADQDDQPVAEIRAVAGVTGAVTVQVTHAVSSRDQNTPVATLTIGLDGQPTETFTDVTMDPDDERYLPAVLGDSALVRGVDLFVPSQSTSTPASVAGFAALTGSASPTPDDYQDALDRLESAEEPELIIACAARQLADADLRSVHQQVVAHCTKMADIGRNRMGLGSITPTEEATQGVSADLDHADDVRSDHFVLCTPAGTGGRRGRRACAPRLLRLAHVQDRARARPRGRGVQRCPARAADLRERGRGDQAPWPRHHRGQGPADLGAADKCAAHGRQGGTRRQGDRSGLHRPAERRGLPQRPEAAGQRAAAADGGRRRAGPLDRRQQPAVPRRRALHPGRFRQRNRPGRHRHPPGPGDRLHQRDHPRPQLTSPPV